jgi:hypothetical protein
MIVSPTLLSATLRHSFFPVPRHADRQAMFRHELEQGPIPSITGTLR